MIYRRLTTETQRHRVGTEKYPWFKSFLCVPSVSLCLFGYHLFPDDVWFHSARKSLLYLRLQGRRFTAGAIAAIFVCACAPGAVATVAAASLARVVQAQKPTAPVDCRVRTERDSTKLAERRQEALALLNEVAGAARLVDDLFYRARLQALAADAMWELDASHARSLFRRAWEAAIASDESEAEADGASGAGGAGAAVVMTEARDDVLKLAAVRDPHLADTFMREMKSAAENDSSAQGKRSGSARPPWGTLSAIGARRLALATELLNDGEPARAADVAAPVIDEGASAALVTFLVRLNADAAPLADSLYLRLAQRTATDAAAGANDVLLLSAYLVSPSLLVVVDERGSIEYSVVPSAGRAPVRSAGASPSGIEARRTFAVVAADILSRPPTAAPDQGSAAANAAYFFACDHLLPFFESEASRLAPALRARRDALAALVSSGARDSLGSQAEIRTLAPAGPTDPLQPALERLSHAADQGQRDSMALDAVKVAAKERIWDRARRIAGDIQDENLRREALSFVAVSQVADLERTYRDDKDNDYEPIVQFINSADLPPMARAWALAQAAEIAARKRDRARSLQLLGDASRAAAQIEIGSATRVAAYAALTSAAAIFDIARAWEFLTEFVHSANAIEDYTGEESTLDTGLRPAAAPKDDTPSGLEVSAPAFRLDSIFAKMARLDYARATAIARTFQGDVPRALALIAVARASLQPSR